ncbi:MAG: type II toxin-antitoxin system antitoxin SocA domain-containing protein [Nostoc sp.]|uniref:Panacea domain-containing protein n=1 Tax=Nostoc sp. TaxID=1180 RepID=UPI002FF62AD4
MAYTTAAAIANYFIWLANETGSYLSNLKLQKLVYYAQAWHLGIYGQPLFDEDFEAWIHGPVIPALYQEYKSFGWKPILKDAEPQHFSEEIQDFLEELTEAYFGCDAFELEQMTHHEDPWIKARENLSLDTPSNAIISKESMRYYYIYIVWLDPDHRLYS